jgi:hypothetical protein
MASVMAAVVATKHFSRPEVRLRRAFDNALWKAVNHLEIQAPVIIKPIN